jgi:aspartate kinase
MADPMIVMKFGGTSLESREAIARVVEIVRGQYDRRPVVVVSAMGKTTNALLAIGAAATTGCRSDALNGVAALHAFHLRESVQPSLVPEIDAHFEELAELVRGLVIMGECTPRATDAVAAFGERLSSLIVAGALRAAGVDSVHIDARRVIVTDRRHTQAAPLIAETTTRLLQQVAPLTASRVVVMGGFLGGTVDGVTTTMGRGGSDYSASLVGAALGAEEIQIWTDVDGMLTADPRILPAAQRVAECSFAEAAELAYFGAKVLHPATVLPAIEKGIPVRILNSRRPENPGTRIVASAVPSSGTIRSMACKRRITLVNVVSLRMLMAHGFLRRIFEVFDRFETPVDMIATSEVSVSLTIDSAVALDDICTALAAFAEVSIEEDQAIVCLVGDNIRHAPNVAARVFSALRDVNIRMISQGASRLNISLVVAAGDLPRALASLHREFFPEARAA